MGERIPEERIKLLDSLFAAFSVIAEGTYVYLCDMKYDYSRWSGTAVESFGLPSEYMYGAGDIWEEHIHPEDRETYHSSIEAIFKGEDGEHDMQYRARKKNGEYDMCTCRGVVLKDATGVPEYFGGVIRNHGVHGRMDVLTGLRNQYGFFDDLDNHITRNTEVTLCMLGISGFTGINEMYGYNFGNLVLQKFGRNLLEYVGNYGSVYRMDGTKFAVISTRQTVEEIGKNYELMREHYRKGITIDDKFLILDLCAGLLHLDNFDVEEQTAYACLNFAYGESKIRRQGDLVVFYNDLSDENRDRLEKLQVIRNSVVQDYHGFFLVYQPVVSAEDERIIGAEALLRWKNDVYGMVPPDHFIPILERDPLFISLGKWILRTALTDGKKFLERCPEFVLNVNLSYTQLEKPDFVEMVLELLEETGYPAEHLCLEITERCRLLDITLLKNVLVNLRARGVKFALDDFGTGFSAISIVKQLSFDTIKIDRSFVQHIEQDEKEQKLVGFFTGLADTFGAKVCIEGIETEGMKTILQQYPVTSFQGYYYSKPILPEQFLTNMTRDEAEGSIG